nr:hypothetical protein [Pseudomonas aeruginosa]
MLTLLVVQIKRYGFWLWGLHLGSWGWWSRAAAQCGNAQDNAGHAFLEHLDLPSIEIDET